jgi:hypothetical protein
VTLQIVFATTVLNTSDGTLQPYTANASIDVNLLGCESFNFTEMPFNSSTDDETSSSTESTASAQEGSADSSSSSADDFTSAALEEGTAEDDSADSGAAVKASVQETTIYYRPTPDSKPQVRVVQAGELNDTSDIADFLLRPPSTAACPVHLPQPW